MGGGRRSSGDARFWEEKARIDQIEPSEWAFQAFSSGVPTMDYRAGLQNDMLAQPPANDPAAGSVMPPAVNPGIQGMPLGMTPEMLLELERAGLAHDKAQSGGRGLM